MKRAQSSGLINELANGKERARHFVGNLKTLQFSICWRSGKVCVTVQVLLFQAWELCWANVLPPKVEVPRSLLESKK